MRSESESETPTTTKITMPTGEMTPEELMESRYKVRVYLLNSRCEEYPAGNKSLSFEQAREHASEIQRNGYRTMSGLEYFPIGGVVKIKLIPISTYMKIS